MCHYSKNHQLDGWITQWHLMVVLFPISNNWANLNTNSDIEMCKQVVGKAMATGAICGPLSFTMADILSAVLYVIVSPLVQPYKWGFYLVKIKNEYHLLSLKQEAARELVWASQPQCKSQVNEKEVKNMKWETGNRWDYVHWSSDALKHFNWC